MNYTYETVGNSSYLVATFVGGQGIVNYELQMLTNNEIRNILVANKHQRNDDIMIQYNITSKIALSQIDSRNKIPREGLISIIEGALIAIDEVEEYQLASAGIVFDEQYIFVNPSTYEPSFVYLPCYTDDNALERLKTFLSALIMGNKVEMSNDNFVQVIIEMLNSPDLNTKALKELCNQFKTGAKKVEAPVKKPEPAPIPQPKPVEKTPVVQPVAEPAPVLQNDSYQNDVKRPEIPQVNMPKKKPEIIQNNKKENAKKTKSEKPQKEKNSKMSIFVVLQIALLVIVAAIFFSGVITNAKYMIAVIVIAAAADFIVYREMFINNKDSEKADKTSSSKVEKKTSASMPQKKVITPNGGVKTPPAKNIPTPKPQQEASPVPAKQYEPEPVPAPAPVVNSVPQAVQVPVSAPSASAVQQDFDLDTEVIDNEIECAYLELYENGIASRIKLDKPVVLVGKLSSQCDFAINSNKISKIHAEFIVRDNEYFVKDCNSTNGTYLNGSAQRITSNVEYQIFDGYRITLANIDLTFRC